MAPQSAPPNAIRASTDSGFAPCSPPTVQPPPSPRPMTQLRPTQAPAGTGSQHGRAEPRLNPIHGTLDATNPLPDGGGTTSPSGAQHPGPDNDAAPADARVWILGVDAGLIAGIPTVVARHGAFHRREPSGRRRQDAVPNTWRHRQTVWRMPVSTARPGPPHPRQWEARHPQVASHPGALWSDRPNRHSVRPPPGQLLGPNCRSPVTASPQERQFDPTSVRAPGRHAPNNAHPARRASRPSITTTTPASPQPARASPHPQLLRHNRADAVGYPQWLWRRQFERLQARPHRPARAPGHRAFRPPTTDAADRDGEPDRRLALPASPLTRPTGRGRTVTPASADHIGGLSRATLRRATSHEDPPSHPTGPPTPGPPATRRTTPPPPGQRDPLRPRPSGPAPARPERTHPSSPAPHRRAGRVARTSRPAGAAERRRGRSRRRRHRTGRRPPRPGREPPGSRPSPNASTISSRNRTRLSRGSTRVI